MPPPISLSLVVDLVFLDYESFVIANPIVAISFMVSHISLAPLEVYGTCRRLGDGMYDLIADLLVVLAGLIVNFLGMCIPIGDDWKVAAMEMSFPA